ncbi:DEAD/DEAH box helicase family protein [Priestia sp. JV24]|uniref:DEAD/DEAH box helicase family protein n=1 Tax=Priestia TaxID=2800373 RepID=UPI0021D6970B|nr:MULTISPECIES: DEAD/DEAH box helicase family protein [Priestia]MCU7712992.1 DEAD/DEAH box helicase family protein [Priestia megaterium]MCW1049177.1 DEAD/DEAH box helicase family protein [Priestia sp. JV24]
MTILIKKEDVLSISSEKKIENTPLNKKQVNENIPKHHVLVHPMPFKSQPNKFDMGKVTNELKKTYSERLSVTKILDFFSKGHCIILSNAETDQDNKLCFISSSLFAIDIDDEFEITNPQEVMFQLKDEAVGLFYTFSHGKKGNRYRLLFQLDQTINDELKMKGIIEHMAKRLQGMGLPVDAQAKNTTVPVRGGRRGYEIINVHNKLNTYDLLESVKVMQSERQKSLYDEFKKDLRPIHFDALKEMAEHIGHIPSGVGQGELWKRLVVGIKHYVNTGYITDSEGFELFDIISGGEQSERAWRGLRANGQATIKSLEYEARNKGYKGKYLHYTNDQEIESTFEKEIIKVAGYIPTEVAKNLITRKQRLLVDSPTGSGKTTAFINAFKELSDESKHFYIFAAPTIALTEQNAISHKLRAVKGQTSNLFKIINQDVKNGQRVFVSTYDMTPVLIEFLQMICERISFTLVIDEIHKFVADYDKNYRYEAIQNLYKVGKKARSFIGLSGTVDDIYRNEFETVVKIDNGSPQSPCQELAIYTYEKRNDALAELAQLIEVWTSQRKLLIYIQSKNKIEQLKGVLQRKGIKVRTINASSKSNTTYRQLVETQQVPEDVQVILTTSVIADGVNIKNIKRDENGVPLLDKNGKEIPDLEWECIAVCNDFSNLFNYSSIKQISNRLRNTYRRFSLFIQAPRNKQTELFNLEYAYQDRLKRAKNIAKEINEHAYFDPQLFIVSEIERIYGVYQSIENNLDVDTLFLRHAVSKEQERYFSGCRFAFIKAVERALHTKNVGLLNISKEIKAQRLDMTFIKEVLQQLDTQEKEEQKRKSDSISDNFTPDIYKAFVEGNEQILGEFKKTVTNSHYACLKRLTTIADYDTCKKVVEKIKRDADTHTFYNSIQASTEALYLQAIDRPSKTKTVLLLMLKIKDFLSKDEYKNAIEKVAKKAKVKPKDVKEVEKMLSFENKRTKKERSKRVVGVLSFEEIAKTYDLPVEKVKELAMNYAKTRGETFASVVKTKLY